MSHAPLVRHDALVPSVHPWGEVVFFASAEVGPVPSEMSLGRCTLYPGQALPKHYHSACTEVVHVLQGTISHHVGDGELATLQAGDTVIVPPQFPHQARNLGEENAVLLISFSAAHRDFIVVDDS
ncbi:MAG: cupin domain-containing protein [Bacteroidota bacterium]